MGKMGGEGERSGEPRRCWDGGRLGGLERAVHGSIKGRRPPENKGTSGKEVREAAGPVKCEVSFYSEWEEEP